MLLEKVTFELNLERWLGFGYVEKGRIGHSSGQKQQMAKKICFVVLIRIIHSIFLFLLPGTCYDYMSLPLGS